MNNLWQASFPLWHFVVRGVLVYVAILAFLRFAGKKQIGQMGTGELVALLLISNAVQNSMNGGDNSVTGGIVLAGVILSMSVLISYLTFRSKKWEGFIEGSPTILIHHGKLIEPNMQKERLNIHELKVILRRQGIHSLDEVYEAVLESDGMVSITKKSELPIPNPTQAKP